MLARICVRFVVADGEPSPGFLCREPLSDTGSFDRAAPMSNATKDNSRVSQKSYAGARVEFLSPVQRCHTIAVLRYFWKY